MDHVDFGAVKDEAALSGLLGKDVTGFRHSVSNQAIRHMKSRHPDLTPEDWGRLPAIVAEGVVSRAERSGVNGVPRALYRATIKGVRYEYVAEYRRRAQRLDAITLYRIGK